MKRFTADFTVKFGNKEVATGYIKGKNLAEVKSKAWRFAIDNAVKFANGQDIDNVVIGVLIEYGSEYFDHDELCGEVKDGAFTFNL